MERFRTEKVTPHPPNPESGSRRVRSIMLPILLPARAFGSILYGLRLRLSVFGLLGSGEGSAGRAVRASLVPRKPTLPAYDLRCATATLAVAPLSPSTYRLFAYALQVSTLPEPLPPAICYAIDTAAIDGNHRQQSPSRRGYLCGTAAKWRGKAVAVGIVGSKWVIVACSSCVRFFFGTRQAFAARKNDTRLRRFRWLNAKDVRPSETNGNRPTTPDFLRHCLCGTAA